MKQALRRAACALLAVVLSLGLVPWASATVFSDISDANTAQNVEVLQMMGVIDGVGNNTFQPSGTLTRAQFCKMAVEVLGQGDRVIIYKNYTIFPDVKPSHWAAGYINLAVRSEEKIISGYSDGTFGPERTITYGQAVTILMRMLGYTDADVGVVWPDGYIDAAMMIGLTQGVQPSASGAVTRGQAAQLFVNLLNCDKKEGGSFASSIATAVENVVMLNGNTKTPSGQPAVLTSNAPEPVPVVNTTGSGMLTGRKGTLLMDKSGKVLTFVPTSEGTSQQITIAEAKAGSFTDTAGRTYTVSGSLVTYYNQEATTYNEVFTFLRPGTIATVYTGASGSVEFLYVGSATSDDAIIVSKDGSTAGFAELAGRTDYKIYKNGEQVSASAMRKYDVATYSAAENAIYVTDNRITVYYLDASPNVNAPDTIQVAGLEGDLTVLPSGRDSLSKFRIGQVITLLLTQDNRVAGAAESPGVRGNAMGLAEVDGTNVTVNLFNGLTVKGKTASDNAGRFNGQVVTVSSYTKDALLSLSIVSSGSAGGSLDVANRKLGDRELAENVRIYEKVGGSEMVALSLSDLTDSVIPSSRILFARRNYADKVDLIILDNVTGNAYVYGIVSVKEVDAGDYSYREVTLDSGGTTYGPFNYPNFHRSGEWAGLAISSDGKRILGTAKLTELKNVSSSAWRSPQLVYVGGVGYTVSDSVICYNRTTGAWITLSDALAFANTMDLIVDENHVVRGVEVSQ